MMRSICKLTLKATVALKSMLEMGIVIILSLIFRDIQNLRSVRIKTLFLSSVLLNHGH